MKKWEKIIILDEKLGKKFEVKELRRGFVNFLLPQSKVLIYNKKNLFLIEKQKWIQENNKKVLEEKARELYQKINGLTFNFSLKKDEKGEVFGSVGIKEVLQELEKSGFLLEKSQLLEFHSLNKLGENLVRVKLSSEIIANLKIIIW